MRCTGRHDGGATQERETVRPGWVLWLLIFGLVVLLSACGGPSAPNPPGGRYTSAPYHFSVNYPQGWQANVAPGASDTIPLTVIITRTGGNQVASHVSTFTIVVFDLKALGKLDKKLAARLKNLGSDKSLHSTQIAGVAGYQSAPVDQPVTGAADVSITHTDYYILRGNYEYQLSTDAVSSDDAKGALETILNSFAFTS
jgi:hypothetical protein